MAFLFGSRHHDAGKWVDELKRRLPEMEFRLWPDGVGDPADIEFTLVSGGRPGMYKDFPNLKAIFSFGAGVDHLMRDPDVPRHVPIGRGVNASLVQNMTHHVVHWVLHFHRGYHRYREFQGQAKWQSLAFVYACDRRVGFLGLGALGADAARHTAALGFPTAGWSRGPKSVDGVESFHGADQLTPFLARTDILVCLLPLTPETTGIINAENLAALPDGAFVINPGRGSHAVEGDVRAALDSGHIEAAALDVFRTEPLPPGDPLWAHPRVYVTPHAASRNEVGVAAAHHARNVRRVLAGELPCPLVDRARGY